MLKQYQDEHKVKNNQFIIVDTNGIILDSDQGIFNLQRLKNLTELHPFFESFISLKDTLEDSVVFNCVHINYEAVEYITDIKFQKIKEGFLLIITDYTSHYTEYQSKGKRKI